MQATAKPQANSARFVPILFYCTFNQIFFWFDIFSVNQHSADAKIHTSDWWRTAFQQSIVNIGEVLLVEREEDADAIAAIKANASAWIAANPGFDVYHLWPDDLPEGGGARDRLLAGPVLVLLRAGLGPLQAAESLSVCFGLRLQDRLRQVALHQGRRWRDRTGGRCCPAARSR